MNLSKKDSTSYLNSKDRASLETKASMKNLNLKQKNASDKDMSKRYKSVELANSQSNKVLKGNPRTLGSFANQVNHKNTEQFNDPSKFKEYIGKLLMNNREVSKLAKSLTNKNLTEDLESNNHNNNEATLKNSMMKTSNSILPFSEKNGSLPPTTSKKNSTISINIMKSTTLTPKTLRSASQTTKTRNGLAISLSKDTGEKGLFLDTKGPFYQLDQTPLLQGTKMTLSTKNSSLKPDYSKSSSKLFSGQK